MNWKYQQFIQQMQNQHQHHQQKHHKQAHSSSQNQIEIKKQLNKTIESLAEQNLGMNSEQIHKLLSDPEVDRLLGSMFGAFIADSLGSYCQFVSRQKATSVIDQTMKMPGGGTFNIHAGQVTDDSQMALHMLQGLLSYKNDVPLKQQIPQMLLQIADQYIAWLDSIPFDIGFTCRTSIGTLQEYLTKDGHKKDKSKYLYETEQEKQSCKLQNNQTIIPQWRYNQLKKAWQRIAQINQNSLSNGFLMRITPMACFYALISQHKHEEIESVKQLIEGETSMTHSNKLCHQSAYQYIQLIRKFVYRKSHKQIQETQLKYQQQFQGLPNKTTVSSFIHQGFTDKALMNANPSQGFFKIAYHYTFHFFKYIAQNCKSVESLDSNLYKHIISQVISEGGDTDTNACIVGGFIGSIIGFKHLPAEYLNIQLNLKLGQDKSHRGEKEKFYQPSKGFVNLIKLILKFRGGKNKEKAEMVENKANL